jgi:hypothetical protein
MKVSKARVSAAFWRQAAAPCRERRRSFFRIEKVKFADVARVNCWVAKVSKAMKTYDEMLNDRR